MNETLSPETCPMCNESVRGGVCAGCKSVFRHNARTIRRRVVYKIFRAGEADRLRNIYFGGWSKLNFPCKAGK